MASQTPFNAREFFEAIPNSRETVMEMLRTQVPAVGPPTPRAQAFINNGEWEAQHKLGLKYLSAQCCKG